MREEYEGKPKTSVLTIPAIGGPERVVTEPTYPLPMPFSSHPYVLLVPYPLLAWAPDSKSLVIIDRLSREEPLALFLISLESGEKTRLTSPPKGSIGNGALAFSPDGASLLFSRAEGPGVASNLYLLPLTARMLPVERLSN